MDSRPLEIGEMVMVVKNFGPAKYDRLIGLSSTVACAPFSDTYRGMMYHNLYFLNDFAAIFFHRPELMRIGLPLTQDKLAEKEKDIVPW